MAEPFTEYRTRVLGYVGSREAAHDLNHLRQIRTLVRSASALPEIRTLDASP